VLKRGIIIVLKCFHVVVRLKGNSLFLTDISMISAGGYFTSFLERYWTRKSI